MQELESFIATLKATDGCKIKHPDLQETLVKYQQQNAACLHTSADVSENVSARVIRFQTPPIWRRFSRSRRCREAIDRGRY